MPSAEAGPILCRSCGRQLTNDPAAANLGHWTLYEPRWSYCADSEECELDVTDEWLTLKAGGR